jgi:hypothetical protein
MCARARRGDEGVSDRLVQPGVRVRDRRRLGGLKHRAALSHRIYSLDRIVQAPGTVDDLVMDLSRASEPSQRPADNELYDRGCDLVEATMAIRRLSGDPEAERAVPALLGCIEPALHELGCAATNLDETGSHRSWTGPRADRMHRGFMNLGLALADAEFASAAARGLAGRPRAASPAGPPARGHGLGSIDARTAP